jgi:hypothetical protein
MKRGFRGRRSRGSIQNREEGEGSAGGRLLTEHGRDTLKIEFSLKGTVDCLPINHASWWGEASDYVRIGEANLAAVTLPDN